ncbi:unnamed protein product [Rhizophagus irregularis]|uniref:Uncharacterized protein n=1 Tax=Rhizophagus irregularis TaxID=588596 RepID=A0A915YVT4_9GLOM|nr:unnamed protein product [Rhizophagus irregularis]
MTEDPEFGDKYGENITYVTISPDGSIVATFNPYDPSILITRVVTNDAATSETVISEAVTCDTITTEVVTNEVATSEAATSKVITSKAVTHNKAKIQVDIKKIFDKKPSNIIGWSLAVSDIVDDKNNIGLVAISCITDKDMNPKGAKAWIQRVMME